VGAIRCPRRPRCGVLYCQPVCGGKPLDDPCRAYAGQPTPQVHLACEVARNDTYMGINCDRNETGIWDAAQRANMI
jgi:hypothetical protein